MTPTPKLRFVERLVYENKAAYNQYGDSGQTSELVKKRILQQWWERPSMGTLRMGFGDPIPIGEVHGEWRDVPIEQEKTK
jgi:hypothetical protein